MESSAVAVGEDQAVLMILVSLSLTESGSCSESGETPVSLISQEDTRIHNQGKPGERARTRNYAVFQNQIPPEHTDALLSSGRLHRPELKPSKKTT